MAKEDFCFTYYDGDAARDKAHMNRLERGAYDDLISAQRKKGHLTLDDIKKVLSQDFEACWSAMQWILMKDDAGAFFIEWVEKSLQKSRRTSKTQKDRISDYWDKKKTETENGNTKPIPRNNHGIDSEVPKGNGDGNRTVLEEGVGETNIPTSPPLVPEMAKRFKILNPEYPMVPEEDYPPLREFAEKILNWKSMPGRIEDNPDPILAWWSKLCEHVLMDRHLSRYSISQLNKYFKSIVQSFTNVGSKTDRKSNAGPKPGKSAGAYELLNNLREEHSSLGSRPKDDGPEVFGEAGHADG